MQKTIRAICTVRKSKAGSQSRNDAMNLKSKTYMKSAEFKARQLWLGFTDAVGIVLEIMANTKEKTADWFKAWVKEFRTPYTIKKQEQLKLNFMRNIKEWASWTPEKNRELFS